MSKRKLGFVVVALMVLVAIPAWAGEKDEAKRLFEAGLKLMKLEDYAGATADFERSISLFPTQHSLFNLANCYRATRRYGDALATLERLFDDFGPSLTPEIQAAASRQKSEIHALVARLTVRVLPVDAVVTVDGRDAGTGPTRGPWLLAPGEHDVAVSRSGFRSQRRRLQLVSGKELHESVELEPLPVAVAVPVPVPPPSSAAPDRIDLTVAPPAHEEAEPPPVYKRWWFWTAGAALVVGASVGIYLATASDGGPSARLGTQEVF